jgi:competence protein ComEA
VGLVVVVAVAAAGFGVRVAWARAASAPRVVAPALPGSAVVSHSPGGTTFASSSTASGGGGPPTNSHGATAAGVTVHVVGQVKAPGVFQLPMGARVADAVAKAGGALKGADLASVNLARVLTDGEQVRVPRPGETVAPPGSGTGGAAAGAGSPSGSGAMGGSAAGGGVVGAGGKLDLNTATAAQLEELPGVGPVLAQRIVDWRTEHGRFASVDELGEVSGIGEKIFAELQPKVSV